MKCITVTFSGHALQRMFARGIDTENVKSALGNYEIVAEYPDDKPYPSRLILAWVNIKQTMLPLHVVVAQNQEDYACYIITAYVPTLELWREDFKTRRPL